MRIHTESNIKLAAPARAVRATALSCATVLFVFSAGIGADQYSEEEVKAAFVFNFAKFVEWPDPKVEAQPAASQDPAPREFKFGVLGQDTFGDALKRIGERQKIKDRVIVVTASNSLDALLDSQVLFICASEASRVEEVVAGMAGRSILTVSDTEDFLKKGGIIALEKAGTKFQFRVNLEAADRANLKLSSQLLQLAKEVKKKGPVPSNASAESGSGPASGAQRLP